jgi:nicotinate phosphoribosyltransferase
MGIIKSLLDTDFYKFTMMQAVLHHYPAAMVRYAFKWRNWEEMNLRVSPKDFVGRLKKELDCLCQLRFTEDELQYLRTIPFFKPDFIEYIRNFRLNRSYISAYTKDDEIKIDISGPWVSTILFEVPVLAIVSQLYTDNNNIMKANWLSVARENLSGKINYLSNQLRFDQKFLFADFGTRRRADIEWHREVLDTLVEKIPYRLVGTSNVLAAKELNIKPIGTMAHEWLQAHQQLGSRLIDSQKTALQTWADEYRGELGIALSDCITFDAFLKDFDRYFGLLFEGCRHDSGDPIWWVEKLIAHYKSLRIDPKTKQAVFSDGLTFELAVRLFSMFNTSIQTSFGIGTHLTNDAGFTAPQIVIKMVECMDMPVAKVSDSTGKGMCEDEEFEHYLKEVIRRKVQS